MPIYEYQCRQCGKRTELLQRMDDPPLAACPECGGEVKKLISSPAFQFKGSGWYATDYAAKSKPGEGKGDKAEGASEGKAEGKTEGKAEGSKEGKEKVSEPAAKKDSAPAASGGKGGD